MSILTKRSGRVLFSLGSLALAVSVSSCSHSSFRPPEREGPPALVQEAGQPRLWLLLKQEEQRSRHLGGARSIGRWVTDIYYHFDLQSHDPATADRLWKKRLLTVKEEGAGAWRRRDCWDRKAKSSGCS